jgi:hypothetical protein
MHSRLKVPKCEIFDLLYFRDFYTIKPFWVGDFGAEIYINFILYFRGIGIIQFLMRMLSIRRSS